jgi:NADH dehydrogenase
MILVIGSSGFVGRNVVELLAKEQPKQVRALVRKAKPSQSLHQLAGVEVVEGDILDPASLQTAMQGVDTVLDFAAATANFKNKANLYQRVNVDGTHNVVQAAEAAGVKRLVFGSGLGTVEGKAGSYMRTRWESEQAVRQSKLDWTILQPSIMFGKGAEFFEAQARIIKMAPFAPVIGNGKTRFQPVYVKDFARCSILSINDTTKTGKLIPLGGPEYFTYKELISLICRTIGKKRLRFYLPLGIAHIQAALFNLLPKPPLTPATLELFDFDNVTPNPQVIVQEFNFKPLPLKEYLEKEGIQV